MPDTPDTPDEHDALDDVLAALRTDPALAGLRLLVRAATAAELAERGSGAQP